MNIRDMLLFSGIALTALFGCNQDIAGGSGTQTTNGICIAVDTGTISGYVYQVESGIEDKEETVFNPPITLQLFDSAYRAFEQDMPAVRIIPDSKGVFGFTALEPGGYTLFAYDTVSGYGIYFSDISVIKTTPSERLTVKKLFSPCGTIQGVIKDLSQREADACGAYISGTPFFEIADSMGNFIFRNVPIGNYSIKSDYFSGSGSRGYLRIKGFIPISDTLVIYTDSVEVEISSDSLMHRVELSL